ncbi:Isopenicillin N synthase [Variovorax sp. YR266]|uniref:isopenicillin N synthase family dioxygenase n=1 Tax=Variovorax sp. YR266 TaxID=1884386 RepID=UPI0008999DE0|nr:2-oxoglutarate and iron-dependent oxygenase domain-containing protein [Variovorax sp. YR266]SDY33442.1 Isopenicillin N synthase [Variovorax sp. YR266]
MHLFERAAVADEAEVINQIPVIDCMPFFRGDDGAEETFVAALKDACENVGFFYIKGHGVPQALIDDCFAASHEFHALPLERKLLVRQDENNIGYMAMNHSITKSDEIHTTKHPNQNASFFLGHDRPDDHPDVVNKVRLRGKNQWPADLPDFKMRTKCYFDALQEASEKLVPAFALALGLDRTFFDEAFANEAYIELRLLHSPPQMDVSDEKFNVAPHTDSSFITLLAREFEEKPALAVRLKSGEWFKAPILEGTFLVNLGDVMRRYSNGTFMSTPHGVINEGSKDRYSIAFFYSPNPNSVVEPVPSKVSQGNPPRYDPKLYGDIAKTVHDRNYSQFKKLSV